MVEYYAAYWNFEDSMRFTEGLLSAVIGEACGSPRTPAGEGHQIDWTPPYPRVTFRELIQRDSGIDIDEHENAESLLAAILDDPASDEPRLVYGDWLTERGDPRGELIALQYKRLDAGKLPAKEAKREKQLLAEHGAKWMHPLDAVVRDPRFERGFVHGCGLVAFETDAQREALKKRQAKIEP